MRDVRDELVLQRVELDELLVLVREQLLRLLGLAAREPLGASRSFDCAHEAGEPQENEHREHCAADAENVGVDAVMR